MSRTFKKYIRHGICCGSNTEWYRERRKWLRKRNRQELEDALKHFEIEDLSETLIFTKMPKRDSWNEPTDGTRVYVPEDVNDRSLEIQSKDLYFRDFYEEYDMRIRRQMKKYHYDKWYYRRNKDISR